MKNEKWEFRSNKITFFGIQLRRHWKSIDLELEYHERLLNKISITLDKEFNDLLNKFDSIRDANIEDLEKEALLDQIDEEGNNFENYKAVYANSIYINIYTILENSLLGICENQYCREIFSTHKKKKNDESLIAYYFRIIRIVTMKKSPELAKEIKLIDNSYRKLRNKLVHNRYLCSSEDYETLKELKGVSFLSARLHHNKYRIVIEDKEFIINFIRRIRKLIKGIYAYHHNNIVKRKFK